MRRFSQLATGVTTRYVEERFGAPAFVRDFDFGGEVKLTEQVYHTRHAWLQILTNEHQAVVRFSITVTDPRFSFQIRDLTVGQLEAKIGQSRFSEIRPAFMPEGRSFKAITRRLEYSESYWLGNPGYDQNFVLSYNDAGTGSFGCSIDQALQKNILRFQDGNLSYDPAPVMRPEYDPHSPCAKQFRAQTVVNTLTVLAAGYTWPPGPTDPEGYPRMKAGLLSEPRGPDLEYVRVLVPDTQTRRQLHRRIRQRNRILRKTNHRGRQSA